LRVPTTIHSSLKKPRGEKVVFLLRLLLLRNFALFVLLHDIKLHGVPESSFQKNNVQRNGGHLALWFRCQDLSFCITVLFPSFSSIVVTSLVDTELFIDILVWRACAFVFTHTSFVNLVLGSVFRFCL
jgi:hypothetical protein